jgi:hypothetical protein
MRYICTPICGAHLTKFIQVYLNGSGTHNHSPYQSEAMENVYYWYDGNVPYCTDATAWQPMDDNFIHMNVPGYFYVDNYGVTHQVNGLNLLVDQSLTFVLDITQLVNIRHDGHVGFQESAPHSYAPQYWEPPCANSPNRARIFSNPASPSGGSTVTSPCASLSSIAWGDSVPSTPHSQHHSHSDDAISGTDLQLNLPSLSGPPSSSVSAAPSPTPHIHSRQHSNDSISESQLQFKLTLPPYPPSIPQMASPVFAQSQQRQQDKPPPELEAAAPTTPPSGPSSPALVSTPPQDLVGRRAPAPAPKRRRITRAVQPLACFFCRGRKIACGPPTNPRGGDRTCEYVVRRLQFFSLKTLFCHVFILF